MTEPTIPEELKKELAHQATEASYMADAVKGEPTLFTVGTRAWRAMRKLGLSIMPKPNHKGVDQSE